MRIICIKIILLLFSWISIQAQPGFYFSVKNGFGFNPDLELNNQPIKNTNAFSLDLEGTYKFKVISKVHFEIGLSGRAIFLSGEIEDINFNSKTLRLLVPIKIGYQLNDNWGLSSGLTFQNNKDFVNIDFREPYFWRVNYTLGSRYLIRKRWFLVGEYNYGLRGVSDPYLVNDPKNVFLVGVAIRI